MKKTLILGTSLLVLSGYHAQAATDLTVRSTESDSHSTVSENVKQGWDKTKQTVSNAAHDTAAATENAYERIKATMFNTQPAGVDKTSASVTFDSRATVKGMIGKPIYDAGNKKIGSVHDIIFDNQGNAALVIVSDGGFMGLARKFAAFDYNLVSQRMKDGDVMMPLTEDSIKKATEFSYNRKDSNRPSVRVMPEGGLSGNTLLKAQIVNAKNESVAQVENITLQNGVATNLIVGFNKMMGMGGEKAAIPFTALHLLMQNDKETNIDFQLTEDQAVQFENFKRSLRQ